MNSDSNDLSLLSFSPEFSSDEICFGEDATLCLTDVVNGKADIEHTHTEYASTSHTHSDYASSEDLATLEDVVDTKANANHTHSGYAATNHTHSEYATQTELDTLSEEVNGKADIIHSHTEYALSNHTHYDYALSSHSHSEYSTINHDHDEDYSAINHIHDNYATLTSLNEVSATVANKANTSHTHNDIYYTEAEIDTKLSAKSDASHTHTGTYDIDGAAAEALISANAYTDSKIDALIGEGASATLDTIGEIASAIEDNQDAIDLLNSAIANKANVTDLNSHASDTEIHVTESEKISWNAKSDFSGSYNDLTNKPNIPSIDGLATENYVNTQIDAIDIPSALSELETDSTHRTVTDAEKTAWNTKSDFSGSYDDLTDKPSIPSVSGLATEAFVDEVVSAKANVVHSHVIADVAGLQSALDDKAVSDHNHNDIYYTETEVNSLLLNKADSTHTHDSSYDAIGTAETKANAVQANLNAVSNDLTEHIESADIHFTATERNKLSGIATGANNYTHPNSGVVVGTYKSVTVNAQGHVTSGTNPTTLAGYGITDADAKGPADNALASAKEYADELIAEEVTNRNSAISTAKSSAISTASSDATTKANNALASAKSYTDTKIAALVDSAPETMDTLKEVADAISAHEDVTDALDAAIGTKANASDLTSHTGNKSNPHAVTKSQVGLGNVPNVVTNDQTPTYSDATTLATLTSGEKLSISFGKIKLAITNLINHIANTSNPHSVTKSQIGLGNVDNTSDVNKPISTATQEALDGKASSSHTHSAATTSSAGFMSASDKSKLDGITASADSVSFSRSLTSGTKVGTITINGTGTDLYAPTNTDTHYASGTIVGSSASATSNTTSALTNGNVYMNHIENGSVKNSHKISGSGASTVTSDASGNIVVSSANTTYGVATSSGLGLVKSGTDITVDSSGNVSVNDDSHNHVISNIDNLQTSLDAKQATVTGGASTITSSNLTANRALISNSSGKVAVSAVTSTELEYLDGVTSNVQTQLDGKSSTSHTHSYAGSSSAGGAATSANKLNTNAGDANTPVYFSNGVPVACTSLDLNTTGSSASCTGNAATATKLQTARTIGLSTGATGTATSFNGTANISIPVTDVKEAYLSWGGRALSGSVSPIDVASSNIHSANRFAFAKAAGITIEYSTDGGSTYSAYSTTDSAKINLVSGIGSGYYIGARSTSTTVNDKLRITLNATNMGLYTRLRKLLINITTNYATGSNVIVEKAMKGSESTYTTVGTYSISGWSGWNSIPINAAFGGGSTQTYNIANLRLTFGITGVNSSQTANALTIMDIVGIGDTYWSYPSNMAKNGHLYTYDSSQNATFPAKVTASSFSGSLSGNATTATTATKLGSSTVGSATQPIYLNGGTATACTYTLGKSVPSDAVFTDTTYSAAGSSLGLVKSGGDVTISSGTITVNDDSHNHVIANVDGLQTALDGKSATSHNHDSAYISKDLQMTADSGDVYVSWTDKDVVAQIKALSTGMYTAYAKSGTTNNPKTTEAWRFMVHKTGANYGWTMAFGSYGSVYSGYVDNGTWKGWRCIYDVSPAPLWTGAKYMTSTDGTPQVVTPSKKLSECQHGWLLLWSDYDPGDGANDADFVTTMIPKRNATGGTWGGKSFLCDIPRYVGSDATDTSTEKRIIKPIYVHDDCIKGSYQNASGDRNDVVLRAVYEY